MGVTFTAVKALQCFTDFSLPVLRNYFTMSQKLISALCMVLYLTLATACSNPTLSSTSFTTQDATILSNIAYVSQFKLECDGEPADIPLFAEVEANLFLSLKARKPMNTLSAGWRKLRKLPVVILKSKSTLMKVMLLFARLNVAEKTHRQSLLWAL